MIRPLLLHYANADPSYVATRKAFYDLKKRLLYRHGTCLATEWQRIRKECWGPNLDDCPAPHWCSVCGGTGIYDETWHALQVWSWGSYTFHVPVEVSEASWRFPHPEQPDIEGYIWHASVGYAGGEARLWLYLLCREWGLFWRELTATCRYGRYVWPLLLLQRIVYPLARAWDNRKQRCWECAARVWVWRRRKGLCPYCRAHAIPRGDSDSEEIPF